MVRLTRREWIAAMGLAGAAACGGRRATGFPGYLLVADAGGKSVTALDLRSFRIAGKIRLPAAPSRILVNGKNAFALTPENGSIHTLDVENLTTTASLRLADDIILARFTPDGTHIAGLGGQSRELVIADPHNRKLVKRFPLASTPFDMDMGPTEPQEGKPIYAGVSGGDSGTVELFNLTTGTRQQTNMDGPIGNLRFRKDAQITLVANYHSQALSVFDTASLGAICDLPVAMRPENLCFSGDFGQLFLSGAGMDGVAIVFLYNMLEVEQTVLAGRQPGVMACSPKPPYLLFVSSRGGPEISILSVDSRKEVALLHAGHRPKQMLVTPDSQYAFALSAETGDLAVIHIPSIRANRHMSTPWNNKSDATLFAMLPVGDDPVHAAVVPI